MMFKVFVFSTDDGAGRSGVAIIAAKSMEAAVAMFKAPMSWYLSHPESGDPDSGKMLVGVTSENEGILHEEYR